MVYSNSRPWQKRIASVISGKHNGYLLLSSGLLVGLSYLFSALEFERDLSVYLDYISNCSSTGALAGFEMILSYISKIYCTDPFLFQCILVAFNFYCFLNILTSINIASSALISFILVANPLALSWISFPSKEAFIIVSTFLILYPFRSLPLKLSMSLLGSTIILIIRPFLIAYVALILLQSYVYKDLKQIRLATIFAKQSAIFYMAILAGLAFLVSPSFDGLYETAQASSLSLEIDGFKNLLTYQTTNIFMGASVNTPLLFLFSLFSTSSSKVILFVANLAILYYVFMIARTSRSLAYILVQILYVLPYSLTVVNSGTALRVLFTSLILSCICLRFSAKANPSAYLGQ